MHLKLIAAICSTALLALGTCAQATVLSTNLIVNPGAEASVGASNFASTAAPSGWTTTSAFTAVQYAAGGTGDLNAAVSAAVGGATNYFTGGPSNAGSTASQTINISDLAAQADAGQLDAHLSGLLGGFASQGDDMTVEAVFRDASNGLLGGLAIGPVSNADRNNVSTLLSRTSDGIIPLGTRSIDIVMSATRLAGAYNDGYADNLSFMLTAVPEADTFALVGVGLGLIGFVRAARRMRNRDSGAASG
jgi:hypothetical protein